MILLKAAFSCMLMKFLLAIVLLLLPAMAEAADITGVPKIREGDQIMIGSSRIRLGGIDAPSVDQLCLNNTGERWTCGVAARDALIHHTDKKSWTCHVLRTDRAAAMSRTAPSTVRTSRNGWWRADGHCPMRGSHMITTPMKRPRAKPRPECGMAPSSRRGTGASATRRQRSWEPPSRRRTRTQFCWPRRPEGRAVARLHHQGQYQRRRRMHLSYAQKPLVCEDQDADQQGHPLVLLGRGGRTGRLSRNPAIDAFLVARARVKRFSKSRLPAPAQGSIAFDNSREKSTMTVRAGREFLAIPGPTNMPDEVLRAMHRPALDIYSDAMVRTDGQPAARPRQTVRDQGPLLHLYRQRSWRLGGRAQQRAVARRQGAGAGKRPLRDRLGQCRGGNGRGRRSAEGRLASRGPARGSRGAAAPGQGSCDQGDPRSAGRYRLRRL